MKYSIVKNDDKVLDIVGNNHIITVAGGFFGDEAKGKITDSLSKYCKIISRVNSGENAGHTVYYKDKPLVFHLVPSGITTGKKCFIGDNCVMDPISVMQKEIVQLNEVDFDYSNLIIGNPFLVFPWHKLVDIMRNPNASTGKGMSAIHQDLAAKRFAKLEDFKQEKIRIEGVKKSFAHWMSILAVQKHTPSSMLEAIKNNPKIQSHVIEFLKESKISSQKGFDYIVNLYEKTIKSNSFPKIGNPRFEMIETINQGEKVLLEGPQSFYLSNIEGTHPSTTTSAHTHSTGILAAAGLPIRYGITQIVVTKVPSSRVGSGANPSGYVEQDWFSKRNLTKEDLQAIPLNFEHVYQSFISSIQKDGLLDNKIYLNENNNEVKVLDESLKINEVMAIVSCLKFGEFGATTGKPRVCGSLDLPHLKHQVNCDSNYICISCIDRLDGLSKVPIVIGYKYIGEDIYHRGQIFKRGDTINLDNFLPDENVLKYCIPIYEVLDGWQNSRKVEIGDKLDENLENFIEIVENSTKAQVVCFGNGPKSDELVYINKN